MFCWMQLWYSVEQSRPLLSMRYWFVLQLEVYIKAMKFRNGSICLIYIQPDSCLPQAS
jgi:hypothetical protein